jgi:hypothetical protein
LLQTTSGAAGKGLGTTAKYLRQTTSGAAGYGLDTTAKYLRGAAGIGLAPRRSTCDAHRGNGLSTTIKYLRRTTGARRQRPEPIPGITDLPVACRS